MSTNLIEVKNSLAKKLIVNFLIICTVAGIILTLLSYYRSKQYVWNLFSRITTSCATSVSHMLFNSPIDEYLNHQQMESYNQYSEILKDFAQSFNLKYLYVYVPDLKNDRIIPVFGVDGQTGGEIKNFYLGIPPQNLKLNKRVLQMFYGKQDKLTLEVNNEYGHVLTGYATIYNKDGEPVAIVGADIEFRYLMQKLIKDCLFFFVFIFSALSILYLLGIFYIQKTFIKPILQISSEMTHYLRHEIYNVSPISLSTDDEINIIANLCNNIAYERKRIENELNIAKKIQDSSLPKIFPPYPEHKEFDIFADITTAKEVGGDFYDFFFVDKDKFAFLIADVCGKGVPAALFMMEVKSVLKNCIKMSIPLDEAITTANREICEDNKQNFFVTVFAAVINIRTGDISFVNAGHNSPLIKRAGKQFEYYETKRNLVLGIMDDFVYQKTDDKLNKDDLLFLYTDGITEAKNESDNLYGEERLKETLNGFNGLTIEEIIRGIENNVEDYSKNVEQSDDITELIFKYNV